jgi:hypothetical protein
MDDRKAKLLRDEIERQQREGRAVALAQRAALEAAEASRRASVTPENLMPGLGNILSDDHVPLEDEN